MLDEKVTSGIGFAMGCIAFSDEALDACVADIHDHLTEHAPGFIETSTDALRMAVAQGLALAGAVKNTQTADALETIMLTVGFFSDTDILLTIKAITLDQALREAQKLEIKGHHEQGPSDFAHLEKLRTSLGEIMLSRGAGKSYFGCAQEA